MESKKGIKDRTAKISENEKAKAHFKAEASSIDANFGEENPENLGQVGQNQRLTEKETSSETTKRSISEPRTSRVPISKYQDQSEDSQRNFLSSFKSILGIAGLVAGGALLFRAARKGGTSSKNANEIRLHTSQTIKRSREELYAYWRNLENLPNFMSHIKEIQEIDVRRSRWTAEVPGGVGTIEWDAVIEQDRLNEYISWRSIADADIENAGEVRFKDAGRGKGTIVETTISYLPPAGKLGEYAAKLLNPAFEKIVKKDLNQFKEHMEKGGEMRSGSGKLLY